MSSFIEKTDYASHLRDNRLDEMIQGVDGHLDKAENRAIKVVKSYLNSRFDIENIFAQTADARDEAILGYTIDIVLYYLYRRINPIKVPDYAKDAYDEAIEWLTGVQQGELVPDGLPTPVDDSKDLLVYGSNKKRENQF